MNTIEQAQEVAARLRDYDEYDNNRLVMSDAADTIDALIAELAALKGQQAIGSVTVSPWRGLENIEWQQSVDIPEGTHMLYLAAGAQPVQELLDAVAAQRKVLEQALVALQSLFSFEVDEHRGERCASAITAIQEQLK